MNGRGSSQAGMSLVELMVALTILAFGLVAILNALPAVYRSAARAQQMTVGALLLGEVQARTMADASWPPVDVTDWQAFEGEFSESHKWKRDLLTVPSGTFVSASGASNLQGLKMTIRFTWAGRDMDREFYTTVANYSRTGDTSYGHTP